jgi:hypothetical protein
MQEGALGQRTFDLLIHPYSIFLASDDIPVQVFVVKLIWLADGVTRMLF